MQLNATRRTAVKAGAATAAALGISGILTSSEIARAEEADSSQVECADVVVVGAGAAGLAAAATASGAGATVVVLESGSFAGGATLYSGGHMLWLDEEFNATQERNDADLEKYLDLEPETLGEAAGDVRVLQGQVQDYLADSTRTGKFDSIERVMVDHYLKGAGTDCDGNPVHLDYAIIRAAAETNMEVFAWLQSGGMEIKDTPYGMHANSPVNGGSSLVEALLNLAESAGAQVRYEAKATGLVVDDGIVVGVRYVGKDGQTGTIGAGRVVLASGGYAANAPLAALYQNVGAGLSQNCGTTNPATNCGEGMVIAQRSGAAVRDLQFLTTVLEGYHNGCTLAEVGKIMGTQQLVVNAECSRFADEATAFKSTMNNQTLNDQTDGLSFLVGDTKMLAALNEVKEEFAEDLAERDWFCVADTLEEAATSLGLDADALAATVSQFNSYVDAEEDLDFGRTDFAGKVEEAPFVVAKMEMHYHLTFGGLVVDEKARVLDINGQPIEGLYAAGDVTSGYEGKVHQSGDCLSVVVHGGIVAGTME